MARMSKPIFSGRAALPLPRTARAAGRWALWLAALSVGLPGLVQAQTQAPVAAAPASAPGSARAGSPSRAPAFTLQPLHWLAGCWASELDEPGSGEQWMAAAGGTMLGMARTLKGGRTVQFEFMQLRETATGVVFIAHPSAQGGTRFAAVEIGATGAVVEQRGPDFPQRVIYRLQPDGRLAARIEGLRHGELRGVDFPMRRIACASADAAPVGSGRASPGG